MKNKLVKKEKHLTKLEPKTALQPWWTPKIWLNCFQLSSYVGFFFFFFFFTFLSSFFGLFLPFCDFDCTILHFDINLSKKLQHSSLASLSAPCSSTASECPSFISPHCLWADCVQLLDRNEINKSTFFYYIFQNLKHGAVNTSTFFFLTLQCLILWYTHCARCRQAVTTIAPLMCEHVDIV